MRTMRTSAAVLVAATLAGCTLADVTVPAGDDRLVVEAVLRTDVSRQAVLLHRGVMNGAAPGVFGAEVIVTGPGGEETRFAETAGRSCYNVDPRYPAGDPQIEAICYIGQMVVLPGGVYELTVRTVEGEVARGRTTVPGAFGLVGMPYSTTAELNMPRCHLPPATLLPVHWTAAPGAWGYLAPLNIFDLPTVLPGTIEAPNPLELVGVAVSAADTMLLLPSEFGVFDRFVYDQDLLRVLQTGLPDGTSAQLVVAAADRNYINGVRGGSFNPSGQIRISSIVGDGVGVFGSLVPLRVLIQVSSQPPGAPPCGG